MKLDVRFSESVQSFISQIEKTTQSFETDFGQISTVTEYVGGECYEGDYVVTPKVDAQSLPTKEKVMLEDMTVKAIPYAEVTNVSNGKTVTIG